MKRMQRLLDTTDTNDFELWLLRSAARERPSASAVAAMRSGLGLSGVTPLRIASLFSLKVTLLAVSFGAFLGLHGTEPSAPSFMNASLAAPGSIALEGKVNAAEREKVAPDTGLTSAPAPQLPVVGQTAASTKVNRAREHLASQEGAKAPTGPDLREEIRLLDSARNAIQGHHVEAALDSLNTYASRFPSGAFKQEASVLRIQAVAMRGETARASSMAKRFVESNPNSPYVGKATRIAKSPASTAAPQ